MNITGCGRHGIFPSQDKFVGKITLRSSVTRGSGQPRAVFTGVDSYQAEIAYSCPAGVVN
jgi:hypothetical protein